MSNKVQIGSHKVGIDEPCFIIAEIGINHNGDIDIAKKLIKLASDMGFDAVKFQKRTIDIVYTPEELAKPRPNHFGKTNGDLKRGLEFGYDEYCEIDKYCKDKGIMWFASPWDTNSVDFLEKFDVPCYKIPSALLTDDDFILAVKRKGKPLILSTGMSTIEEIDHAVNLLQDISLVILHCTSTYPSKAEELNLKCIDTLRKRYGKPTGYSGHEPGVSPSVISVAAHRSCVVERHITLNRTMWGSDQAASLEKRGMELLVRDIRMIPAIEGDGIKRVYDSEIPIKEKLRKNKE
jgi:N-acetylneuraminate synthase